ncbi:MAG TPA: hypothetical protein VHX44_17625 [Planctomycetota bacterium]|nr:hypothetical protein [Planctomycetota bacterium]
MTALLVMSHLAALVASEPRPDLKPVLGERGAVIFAADFNAKDAIPFSAIDSAKVDIVDSTLRLVKRAEAKHIGVAYLWKKEGPPPINDFIMQADFRFDAEDNFGFEFKRPGKVVHGDPPEFFVTIRHGKDPQKPWICSLVDNCPSTLVATQSFDLTPGQWGRVLIEVCKDEVAVQIENGPTLRGACKLASSPKGSPQISFNSNDEKAVSLDNLTLWAVK